jgi:hypothetical protein
MRSFIHNLFLGWRFVAVAGGISSSLMFSLFIFRVFMGLDFPLLGHIELTQHSMAWIGLLCAFYSFVQQQALATRPAMSIGVSFADGITSCVALTTLAIFGWLRWILGETHFTEWQWWALAMFTLTTIGDGFYNSFISIRYLPRYIDVERAHV